jgi:hypothetical protein
MNLSRSKGITRDLARHGPATPSGNSTWLDPERSVARGRRLVSDEGGHYLDMPVLAARSAAVVRSWSATLFDHDELGDCRAPRRALRAVPLNRLTTNTPCTLGRCPRDDMTVTFDRIELRRP